MEPTKPARELWSKDDVPTPEINMEEIITRADALRRKVRNSNMRELIAATFVVVVFVAMAAIPGVIDLPTMSRVGAALIACATIFVSTYLLLRGAPIERPVHRSTLACYRDELERRRALLASVVKWYVAPFWPGIALFIGGVVIAHWGEPPAMRSGLFALAVVAVVNVGVVWINRRAAKKLGAELAALPVVEE